MFDPTILRKAARYTSKGDWLTFFDNVGEVLAKAKRNEVTPGQLALFGEPEWKEEQHARSKGGEHGGEFVRKGEEGIATDHKAIEDMFNSLFAAHAPEPEQEPEEEPEPEPAPTSELQPEPPTESPDPAPEQAADPVAIARGFFEKGDVEGGMAALNGLGKEDAFSAVRELVGRGNFKTRKEAFDTLRQLAPGLDKEKIADANFQAKVGLLANRYKEIKHHLDGAKEMVADGRIAADSTAFDVPMPPEHFPDGQWLRGDDALQAFRSKLTEIIQAGGRPLSERNLQLYPFLADLAKAPAQDMPAGESEPEAFDPKTAARTAKVGDKWPEGFEVADVERPGVIHLALPGSSIGIQYNANSGTCLFSERETMAGSRGGSAVMWAGSLRRDLGTLDEAMVKLKSMAPAPVKAPAKEPVTPAATIEPQPAPPQAESGDTIEAKPDGKGRRQFVDTGEKIGGARKDTWRRVANGTESFDTIDWDDLETEPEQAASAIKKANLLSIDPDALKDAGMESKIAYLCWKILGTIAPRPKEDTADARKSYAKGIALVEDSILQVKKGDDIRGMVRDLRDMMDGAPVPDGLKPEHDALERTVEQAREALTVHSEPTREAWRHLQTLTAAKKMERYGPSSTKAEKQKLDRDLKEAAERYSTLSAKNNAMYSGPTYDAFSDATRAYKAFMQPLIDAHRSDPTSDYSAIKALGDRFESFMKGKGAVWEKNNREAGAYKADDWSWADKEPRKKGVGEGGHGLPKWSQTIPEDVERTGGSNPREYQTSDDLKNDFGLRGIEYGNYVNEAEAAHHTRRAGEAMNDLAEILGVEPKTVSMNGRLAMAFGARGKGGHARAHYERGKMVINLTKYSGGGTLAHEWAHALDNVMALHATGDHGLMVSQDVAMAKQIDPELHEAWQALHDSIMTGDNIPKNKQAKHAKQLRMKRYYGEDYYTRHPGDEEEIKGSSRFHEESRKMGEYWRRPREMFARAFEAYVTDKLADGKRRSSYLVSGIGNPPEDAGMIYPYPRGEERKRINAAFDGLFAKMRAGKHLEKAAMKGLLAELQDAHDQNRTVADLMDRGLMPDVVVVVITDPSGRVLIARRSLTETNRAGEWETPGGHTDPGEGLMQAAKREVFEETGLTVKFAKGAIWFPLREGGYLAMLRAHWLGGEIDLDLREHDEAIWLEPDLLDNIRPVPPRFAENVRRVLELSNA